MTEVFEFVSDPFPKKGIFLPLHYENINKAGLSALGIYDPSTEESLVWFSYEDIYRIATMIPGDNLVNLYWFQKQALVQKGWLTEHEKPHRDYSKEPFRVTDEFFRVWPSLANQWGPHFVNPRAALDKDAIRPSTTDAQGGTR